jgi:hypothetical protein
MRSALFIGRWLITSTLVGLIAIYLWYASDHVRLLLGFPFPLDYGEGPLLAQIQQLLAKRALWQIYADPAQAPFLVVNYPPLYLVFTSSLAGIIGEPLLAGRIIALFGALASTAALAALIGRRGAWMSLLWLTIPVVREWMPLMRVDLLGVALGLWSVWLAGCERLPAVQRGLLAGLLAVGCLLTKPSLIAGPAAAAAMLSVVWYRSRSQPVSTAAKAAITYITTVGLVGGSIVAALSWMSHGWFLLHVVAANANRWEANLAADFWRQQLGLRWPLLLTALIGSITIWHSSQRAMLIPALTYLLAGTIEAIGVGKVGAYANYFFEWYAALIWLSGAGWSIQTAPSSYPGTRPLMSVLIVLSLLYYPPLWDTNRLRPAGLIEPSPPRFVLGSYGLWADAQREAAVLAALHRTTTALTTEVRASGEVIFTDLPGLASGAGLTARIPVFEFRQLLDQGYVDQTTVLYELANGKFPLILIDYLGNWLTPEMVAIIRHRYAQDGVLGVIDRYRPIATGSTQSPLHPLLGGGIQLVGVQIASPTTNTYEPGDLVVLNLIWQRTVPAPADDLTVVVQLRTADERLISQHERPLVYGALPPSRWPESASIDHLQPITLPPALLPGDYLLTVSLRDEHGNAIAAPQPIARIPVAAQGGMFFTETGYFVPAPFMRAWAEAGALERGGWPLTPAVPFAWGWLQCFERICLEWRDGIVQMRPLGIELYMAETLRSDQCNDHSPAINICTGFSVPEEVSATLGQVLSGEISRHGWIVQWTEYARLERSPDGTTFSLGRLGDETLRLPPGVRYRWPE